MFPWYHELPVSSSGFWVYHSRTMDYGSLAVEQAGRLRGKLGTTPKAPLDSREALSIQYTPGVAAVSSAIACDAALARTHTVKGNSVAVISDGSAVLGLGNIGPLGALPVMEGKAVIFKRFAGIDAWPVVLDVHETKDIVRVVRAIAPGFGAINLEDIAAPRCFAIEAALQDLGIPVMHDDQHGTAVVVYAGLLNALKIVGKKISEVRIVILGAGAAGQGITRMLVPEARDVIVLDRKGALYAGRPDMDEWKTQIASFTNREHRQGSVADVIRDVDVFIGVSGPRLVTTPMLRSMGVRPIVFALSNPIPEIMPEDAQAGGASVIASGRSDFPNQVNNALAYPGIFRGALDAGAACISEAMKRAAAVALASLFPDPTSERILPDMFDERVVPTVAAAVRSV